MMFLDGDRLDERPEVIDLLAKIKTTLSVLIELQTDIDKWVDSDSFYRFYHQSFKVYALQNRTRQIVDALVSLSERPLNPWFEKIVSEGTNKVWEPAHNDRWLEETRPILEAYFHARKFLDLVIRCARELDKPPAILPSGWAAVLYLYNL